jgi:hypothetical protein
MLGEKNCFHPPPSPVLLNPPLNGILGRLQGPMVGDMGEGGQKRGWSLRDVRPEVSVNSDHQQQKMICVCTFTYIASAACLYPRYLL